MWKCGLCNKENDDDYMAIKVRFGYIDSNQVQAEGDYYFAFNTEESFLPLCDECAISCIRGEYIAE